MSNRKPSFTFEIDNFSSKEYTNLSSETFVSGGCEWSLSAHLYPKDHLAVNHLFPQPSYSFGYGQYGPYGSQREEQYLSLYLEVANPRSLKTRWETSAEFYFVVSNQSGKELYKTWRTNNLFWAESIYWGFDNIVPLSNLIWRSKGDGYPQYQHVGVSENLGDSEMDNKLIIDVYITNVEVVVSEEKEIVEINGFQVLASQANQVTKLFAEHPHIAKDFKLKNQVVKTEFMNVLLSLIETLGMPLKNFSETELSIAHTELCDLIKVGFKLDWLRSKFEEVPLEMKKADDADGSQVQQHEERIKNLEQMISNLKVEMDKKMAKFSADGYLIVDNVA